MFVRDKKYFLRWTRGGKEWSKGIKADSVVRAKSERYEDTRCD